MKYLDTTKFEIKLCDETPQWRTLACSKEPETIQWIEKYFKPKDIFINIGACCGTYSLYAAQFCNKIYCFEPAITNFVLLMKNIEINNLNHKIKAFPFAIGDYTAPTLFVYKSLNPGSTHDRTGSIQHWTYQYKLDQLVAESHIQQPNHILIDTDGFEYSILQSAHFILSNPKLLTMQIECLTENKNIQQWISSEYGFKIIKETIRNNPNYTNVLFERK